MTPPLAITRVAHRLDVIITARLEVLLGRLPIGWLQLRHNPTRLLAAIGGVAFASLLVLMQLGFYGALVGSIGLPYRAIEADMLITAADMHTLADASPIARARLLQVASVPGVESVHPVHLSRLDWRQPDGTVRTLDTFGFEPYSQAMKSGNEPNLSQALSRANTIVIDSRTRNINASLPKAATPTNPLRLELKGREVDVIGTVNVGGGFSADGYAYTSDQTFLRLFPNRSAGAPTFGAIRLQPNADPDETLRAIRARLGAARDVKVRTLEQTILDDQKFQTTQRPVGLIFGFGIVMGLLVGSIIVYQVLTSDVADHLKEYATLKAVGYAPRFFLSIIFEEAVVLGWLGFIPALAGSLVLYTAVAAKTGLPIAMTPGRALIVLIGTVCMCAVSGAIATKRLARANPAELF